MSPARPWCDQCKRAFTDENALWQHNKYSHRMNKADNPHPRPREDGEPSYLKIETDS